MYVTKYTTEWINSLCTVALTFSVDIFGLLYTTDLTPTVVPPLPLSQTQANGREIKILQIAQVNVWYFEIHNVQVLLKHILGVFKG